MELKNKELQDRELKRKRNRRSIFKPIIVSIDDMEKLEQKEMVMKRPIETTWYDCLINYIPDTIRKNVGDCKDKVVSLLKKNTCEDYGSQTVNGRRKKTKNTLKETT